MGEVFAAEHIHINRKLALKLLRKEIVTNEEAVARFKQEAYSASSIRHKNIVEIVDFGELEDGRIYMCMEFLSGSPLNELIAAPVLPERIVGILAQTCDGLAAAHNAGIVHRDMKPENVFVIAEDIPKILDFGIAKVAAGDGENNLTRTGMVFGTPYYMSPEQALGKPVDARTDVYAMGVIMYEIFAGSVPFDGASFMGILTQHVTEDPEPLVARARSHGRQVPAGIVDIVEKAMSKKKEKRYSSMEELARVLRAMNSELCGVEEFVVATARASTSASTLISNGRQAIAKASEEPANKSVDVSYTYQTEQTQRRKNWFPWMVVVFLTVAGGVAAWGIAGGKETREGLATESDTSSVTPQSFDVTETLPGSDIKTNNVFADGGVSVAVVATGQPDAHVVATGAGNKTNEKKGTTSEIATETAPPKQPEPDPATFQVKVTSRPRGATVYSGRKKMGKTPLVLRLEKTTKLRIKRRGFSDRVVVVTDKKEAVFVRLQRKIRKKRTLPTKSTPKTDVGQKVNCLKDPLHVDCLD